MLPWPFSIFDNAPLDIFERRESSHSDILTDVRLNRTAALTNFSFFFMVLFSAPQFGNLANLSEIRFRRNEFAILINTISDAMAGKLDALAIAALKVDSHAEPLAS
jgi:hypothetical protein